MILWSEEINCQNKNETKNKWLDFVLSLFLFDEHFRSNFMGTFCVVQLNLSIKLFDLVVGRKHFLMVNESMAFNLVGQRIMFIETFCINLNTADKWQRKNENFSHTKLSETEIILQIDAAIEDTNEYPIENKYSNDEPIHLSSLSMRLCAFKSRKNKMRSISLHRSHTHTHTFATINLS